MESEPFITQVELVAGILAFLDGHGFRAINARQMNAIIRGADEIMAELRQPHTEAAPACGLQAWLASDSTGTPARYMARALGPPAGIKDGVYVPQSDEPFPHDPSDFARCVGLLDAVPELRPHMPSLADGHGPV